MAENTEWTEEFNKKLASLKEAGADISVYMGIKTQADYEAKKAEIDRKLKDAKTKAPEVKPAEAQNTGNASNNGVAPKASERKDLTVSSEPQTAETPSDDLQWIEEKRKFWKEYAEKAANVFENDAEKDIASKSFVCALTKDNDHGEIKYSSPTNAQVSKDSHLVMYQGLVKDALNNNMSITFGQSLDNKQKATLLAACLIEQGTYPNGDKLAITNPPKIDMKAEYIKELPESVQKTLGDYVAKQKLEAKQQEAQQKISELKKRLKENDATEGKTPEEQKNITKERREIRKEQLASVKDLLTSEQIAAHEQKAADREKIMAARLGITGAYTTKDSKGNERVVTKEKGLDKAKDSKGKLRVPQYMQKALAEKYGKNQGK